MGCSKDVSSATHFKSVQKASATKVQNNIDHPMLDEQIHPNLKIEAIVSE